MSFVKGLSAMAFLTAVGNCLLVNPMTMLAQHGEFRAGRQVQISSIICFARADGLVVRTLDSALSILS